jgi:molybdopterin-containing oxidoreductase family iron-sulfur binding subunit
MPEADTEGREGSSDRAMDRRRFLKMAGIGAGAVAILAFGSKFLADKIVPAASDPRLQGSSADSWVMLIDLDKCDGCGKCTTACQQAHYVPAGQTWIQVYQVQDEKGGSYFLPRPCFNCRNAPCLKVCPVGATYADPDGIIMVDQNRCIGCRYCMAACPYNARFFNWTEPKYPPEALAHPYSPEEPWPTHKGVVMKCMFCAHHARKGELPECAEGCPMGAIYFGNEAEDAVTNILGETLPFRATLTKEGGFRWKEELGTDPRVYYLPARR